MSSGSGTVGDVGARDWIRAALAMFAVGWGANQFAPLLSVYQTELGMGQGEVTGMFAVYIVGLIPALVLAGRWSDAHGRRVLMRPVLVLSLAATVIMLLGPADPVWLYLGRFLAGWAAGAAFRPGGATGGRRGVRRIRSERARRGDRRSVPPRPGVHALRPPPRPGGGRRRGGLERPGSVPAPPGRGPGVAAATERPDQALRAGCGAVGGAGLRSRLDVLRRARRAGRRGCGRHARRLRGGPRRDHARHRCVGPVGGAAARLGRRALA